MLPKLLPGINRVDSLKILGVTVRNDLIMHDHVSAVCESAAQSLYAVKLLKSHGLGQQSIRDVCRATVISRLTYASPGWWGFCNATDKLLPLVGGVSVMLRTNNNCSRLPTEQCAGVTWTLPLRPSKPFAIKETRTYSPVFC